MHHLILLLVPRLHTIKQRRHLVHVYVGVFVCMCVCGICFLAEHMPHCM